MENISIGEKVRQLKAQGVRPMHIARQVGINITAVYYHIDPTYREKSIQRSTQRRKENKKFAVAYKGGKCAKCGYCRCSDALVFHHIDPMQKEMAIAGTTLSRETLKRELDKTVMLCAICHIELHDNLWTQDELDKLGLKYIPTGMKTGKLILPFSKRTRSKRRF